MPRGDAVQTQPTVADEMAKFSGFSTKDGETVAPAAKPAAEVVTKETKETKPAAAAVVKEAKAAPAKLTDEESEAAITALDEKLGREATTDEISHALRVAALKKNGAQLPTKTLKERAEMAFRAKSKAEGRLGEEKRLRLAAEARATAAEAALQRGDTKQLTSDTKKANDATDAAPDPKAFEFGEVDSGYIRALARYEAKQEIAAQSENQKKTQLTAEQREAAAKFEEAKTAFEDAGEAKYEDFEEVVMQGARDKAWPLSDSLGAMLFESDHGVDIAYELASNPKLAKEIFGKTALQQAAWLGRKEAELSAGTGATASDDKAGKSEDSAAKAANERKVSKAPAPVTRARGQGSNSSVPGDTTDFAAFEAAAMGRNKP